MLDDSMKSLEICTDQVPRALKKTVVNRFEVIKKIIRANNGQGEKVKRQGLTLSVCVRVRDGLPRVFASYPVITS